MHPPACWGVQPGCSEARSLVFGGSTGARFAARSTAWYLGNPALTPPAPEEVPSPVTIPSLGAGTPFGPITFGSQS